MYFCSRLTSFKWQMNQTDSKRIYVWKLFTIMGSCICISVKSVFKMNVAIRWKIPSHKLYASIVQFSCVQWNFNQSRFLRSNLFVSSYNFVFYFLTYVNLFIQLHSQNGHCHKNYLPIYLKWFGLKIKMQL